jgi:hypothetical protein
MVSDGEGGEPKILSSPVCGVGPRHTGRNGVRSAISGGGERISLPEYDDVGEPMDRADIEPSDEGDPSPSTSKMASSSSSSYLLL